MFSKKFCFVAIPKVIVNNTLKTKQFHLKVKSK